jgi:hypothetical protein
MAWLRDELLAELTRREADLAELERQRDAARSRMEALRAELVALSADEPVQSTLAVTTGPPAPSTPTEKVRLFRGLFKGREDIFPTRFLSKKTGKAGYAPACARSPLRSWKASRPKRRGVGSWSAFVSRSRLMRRNRPRGGDDLRATLGRCRFRLLCRERCARCSRSGSSWRRQISLPHF